MSCQVNSLPTIFGVSMVGRKGRTNSEDRLYYSTYNQEGTVLPFDPRYQLARTVI